LLHEQLTVSVENEERKGTVQDPAAGVAVGPVEVADFAIGIVHEYQPLRIHRNSTKENALRCLRVALLPPPAPSRHQLTTARIIRYAEQMIPPSKQLATGISRPRRNLPGATNFRVRGC
jgi:hypothetical protein